MKSYRTLLSLLCCLLMLLALLCGCTPKTPAESGDGSDAAVSEADSAPADDSSDAADDSSADAVDPAGESSASSAEDSTASTTKKPGGNKPSATAATTLNNIPTTDEAKWGTKAGLTSVKKVPDWMKSIKSGNLTLLGPTAYGEGNETQAYLNMKTVFKALTGKELKITTKVVDWGRLRSTLQTMVVSNNGPDVFSIYNGVGYYLRNKNLTRDIRDYINMNDAAFKDLKDPSEVMFYKGQLTGFVTTGDLGTAGFVYNKTLIDRAGLDDPWELYTAGKWTIAKFLEYVEELTVDQNHDGTAEVFGVSMAPEALFGMALSSGEDLVKFNADGSVSNNLRSATFTRWAKYAREITAMGSYDTESWTRGTRFAQGKVAFCQGNIWLQFQNANILKMKKAGKVGWVPYPMDINQKVHWLSSENTVWFLPKNSKNPEGGAAYLYAMRYAELNPNAKLEKEEKAKYLNEYAFTEQEWQFIHNELKLPFTVKPITFNWMHIPDFSYTSLWNVFTTDWSTLVEEVYPSLQSALNAQNK